MKEFAQIINSKKYNVHFKGDHFREFFELVKLDWAYIHKVAIESELEKRKKKYLA